MKYFKVIGSIKFFLYLFITISFVYDTNAKSMTCLKTLIENVFQNPRVYQALLFFDLDEKNTHPEAEGIIFNISRAFPIRLLSFQEITEKKIWEMSDLPEFQDPKSTNIIITICLSRKSRMSLTRMDGPSRFLFKLSEVKIRPRCLFVFLDGEKTAFYREFLRYMWSQRILDATILKLISIKSEQRSFFTGIRLRYGAIYHFNPFMNRITKVKYSNKITWFPDKTVNMNDYYMKVGVLNYPPVTIPRKNSTGHVQDAQGSEAAIIKIVIRSMKSKIIWIPPDDERNWGSLGYSKENSTGLFYSLINNEIQMIAAQRGRLGSREEKLFEISRGSFNFRMIVVVPILKHKSVLSVEWNISCAIAVVSLITIIWIISHLLKFERSNWQFLYIYQIVLGLYAPRDPEKIAERILFGSILCACLLYSSEIYTAFVNIASQKESQLDFATLHDVVASDLPLTIGTFRFIQFYENSEGDLRTLLDKSTQIEGTGEEFCIKRLSAKRDVACLSGENRILFLIKDKKDDCGNPIIKVVKESVLSTVSIFAMEPGSPFVRRFDKLVQRLTESGITEALRKNDYTVKTTVKSESCSIRGPESTLLYWQMISILGFGYSLSVFVFVCEQVVAFIIRQSSQVHDFNRNVNKE